MEPTINNPCIFCEIVDGRAYAQIVKEYEETTIIVPLNPVTQGHLLVIPKIHVPDFTWNPSVSAATMFRAGEFASQLDGDFNLITSRGKAATQSVFHLHIHLVPRKENDGLALPWYSGKRKKN